MSHRSARQAQPQRADSDIRQNQAAVRGECGIPLLTSNVAAAVWRNSACDAASLLQIL